MRVIEEFIFLLVYFSFYVLFFNAAKIMESVFFVVDYEEKKIRWDLSMLKTVCV
jgi:hypothetical protein